MEAFRVVMSKVLGGISLFAAAVTNVTVLILMVQGKMEVKEGMLWLAVGMLVGTNGLNLLNSVRK